MGEILAIKEVKMEFLVEMAEQEVLVQADLVEVEVKVVLILAIEKLKLLEI